MSTILFEPPVLENLFNQLVIKLSEMDEIEYNDIFDGRNSF